jgi:hypothetical protein
MMPPMSPPQSGNNSPAERPEASDLLNPDGTPWASQERGNLAPDAPSGVGPGAGLPPMIPPMVPPWSAGGAPPQRSGAADGLDAESAAWQSPDTVPPAPGMPSDTVTGDADARTGALGRPGPAQPPVAPSWALPSAMPMGIVPGGRARNGSSDDDEEDGIMPPLFLPPLPSADDERRPSRRTEAGELLEEQAAAWGSDGARAVVHDEPADPDRVAVVVDDDEDDFTSWDSDDLPWGSEAARTPSPAEDDDDQDAWGVVTPPPAAPDPGPGDDPAPRQPTYARRRPAETLSEADYLVAEGILPAVRAGGPDLTDEEFEKWQAETAAEERRRMREAGLLADEEDEEDEVKERRAADLLHRDTSAWGGSAATSGTIG